MQPEKDELRLAHLLLVHKNPDQVNAFLKQIARDGRADVYVHVDKKSPEAVLEGIAGGPNVHVLSERIEVTWGDFSMIDATLLLLRKMRGSGRSYDFVCLNSGQDLLVKDGLAEHLARNRGAIFMDPGRIEPGDPRSSSWRIRWPRVTRNRFDSPLHPFRLLRAGLGRLYSWGVNLCPNPRALPDHHVFHRGSQWFCLPGEAAGYMLDYLDRNPACYEVFKEALVPDMSFFHTLIMNSPYAERVAGEILTYLNFGKSYKDNNHAVVLTMKDVPDIEKSGKYFARKFDAGVDNRVIAYFCDRVESPPEPSLGRPRPA